MSSDRPLVSADGKAVYIDRGEVGLLLGVESLAALRGDPETLRRALAARDDDPDEELRAIRAALAHPIAALPDGDRPVVIQLNLGNTTRCNMRCSYCYNALPTKEGGGAATQLSADMTPELARAAVDALLANAEDCAEVVLVFIGGEALLQRRLIEQTLDYAERRCRAARVELGKVVYTNGVLMKRDVIEWANANDVSLVVSLDGPPAVHDRHRKFPTGKPTSAVVLKNIELLMQHSESPLRRVRAVATERGALLPLHQYLYDLGFNEIQVQAAYGTSGYEGRDELTDLEALLAWYRTLLLSGVVIHILPFVPVLERLRLRGESVLNWYPCNAGFAALGVDGQGDLYPCHHFLGEQRFRVGNIKDGIPAAEARGSWFHRVDERDACRACWARHLCGGECYHRAATGGPGFAGAVEQWCEAKRAMIVAVLDVLTLVADRRPHVLEELLANELTVPTPNSRAFEVADLDLYL